MQKKLLLFLLCIFVISCNNANNINIDESNPFMYSDILVLPTNTFFEGETKSSKTLDSGNNLIGFQNDFEQVVLQEFDTGLIDPGGNPIVLEILIRVFKVEITEDFQDYIYLKINETELDEDDINELLQNKCFIRFEYPYKETNNTSLLMQDLKTNYCSQD